MFKTYLQVAFCLVLVCKTSCENEFGLSENEPKGETPFHIVLTEGQETN